ncbi:MAG TPA: hydroxyacid dehydrogenase [Limnochordia bacterium]|nr:hydroxyacid dehydrogenase [Limnochordia bacterium]
MSQSPTAAPRVTLLVEEPLQRQLFTDQALQQLAGLSRLTTFNGQKRPTPADAAPLLADADLVICSWGAPRFDEALLAQAPNLKRIVYSAGSIKPIVTEAVPARGVVVTSGAAAIAENVAEYTLGLIIMSLKNAWRLNDETKAGRWRNTTQRTQVRELFGLTIGIAGGGAVGRAVLRLLAPFTTRRLLFDPYVSPERAAELGARKVELDELLSQSDVVTLHVPNVPSAHHMVSGHNLGLLKDGAILINTARGGLIDEAALLAELKRGRIYACLDVTDPEPPPADHPLFGLENVMITPHIAGGVGNGRLRLGQLALEEVKRFADGREALYPVDLTRLNEIA